MSRSGEHSALTGYSKRPRSVWRASGSATSIGEAGPVSLVPHRDRLVEILRNRPRQNVDAIVVTDGQRILGLGDQGRRRTGYPDRQALALQRDGGSDPARTLPIVLDVGTDNHERLADPEYIGWRHERIDGEDHFDFVERFVKAVEQELPGTLMQW